MAIVTLTGRVVSGLGEAASFTQTPWARETFIAKLGIDPYPGTVNLALVDPAERARWVALRTTSGMFVPPPEPQWCGARLFRARIAGRIDAGIVFPEVPFYPEDKLELIAAVAVREALSLAEGDTLTIAVEASDVG